MGNNLGFVVGKSYVIHESEKLCNAPHEAVYKGSGHGRHSFEAHNFRKSGSDVVLTSGEQMLMKGKNGEIYLNDSPNAHWSWDPVAA